MTVSDAYLVPQMRPLHPRRSSILSVLDVGSTKTVCLIARLKPNEKMEQFPGRTHSIEVLGYGHQRSLGVKSGLIVDIDAAERAVRNAVDAAEKMAGITIESLILPISAGRLASKTFAATVRLDGEEVTDNDLTRVLGAGSAHACDTGRAVLHTIPISYSLDGHRGIDDPRGMVADKLSVDMHVVTADIAPLRNLELLVNRCHLDVETVVAGSYAGALSVLADDETNLGVAHIDMGGGTTSIALFAEGTCVHVESIPIGGRHVTVDIARALTTSFDNAERLKTLHGGTVSGAADEREILTVPTVASNSDDDAPLQIPRSSLVEIIRPRIEETLELIRDRVSASGYAGRIGGRVVLSGGASQLPGIAELTSQIVGRTVRYGRPLGISGLPAEGRGPALATAAGLLIYPQVAELEQMTAIPGHQRVGGGYLSRVSQWLRESF